MLVNSEYVPIKSEDEIDIEIYKINYYCWKCKSEMDFLTYHSQVDGTDHYLGSLPFVDELLLKKYPDLLQRRISKTKGYLDIVNVCIKCNQIQGNFFQWELWDEIFFKRIKPELLEVITVKISDLLSQEELDLLNMEEKEIYLDNLNKTKRKAHKN